MIELNQQIKQKTSEGPGRPQSLKCSGVKHRPTSLVSGWVTTRAFNDESSPPRLN